MEGTLNPATLMQMMKSPAQASAEEIGQLEALVEEFPFSDLLYTLLIMVTSESDSRYDKRLQDAALRVRDRGVLQRMLAIEATEAGKDGNAHEPAGMKGRETLLEEFLRKDPRIIPDQADHEDATRLAEMSNRDDKGLISETLARIYLMQGRKGKAKQVYEKLRLIYPEKSAYFAALIEDIDNREKDSEN